MKKIFFTVIILAVSQLTFSQEKKSKIEAMDKNSKILHDFKTRTIDGKDFDKQLK